MPEENQNQKILLIGGVIVFLLIAGIVTFSLLSKSKTTVPETAPSETKTKKVAKKPPTLSPERIEIIKKMETHVVTIQGNTFTPSALTVKLHDQVQWKNNDTVAHKVKGENWGNVPIQPGQSFTQAFKTPGVFHYTDALNPELVGTITVE